MSKAIVPKDFYVYIHRRATTKEIFYVGKGHGRRAKDKNRDNHHWRRVVAKHGLIVEIAYAGLQEWAALEIERELIALYGRRDLGDGPLVNMTDGGEGQSGFKHSAEARAAISQANVGHTRNRGRVLSEEHKQKIKKHLIGNSHTKGKKLSNEHKEKVVKSLRKNGWPSAKKVVHVESGLVFDSSFEAIDWLECQYGILARPSTFSSRMKMDGMIMGNMFLFADGSDTYWSALIQKKRHLNEAARLNRANGMRNSIGKSVLCVESGDIFATQADAAKWAAIKNGVKDYAIMISNCCRGKTKTAYGYTWRYA